MGEQPGGDDAPSPADVSIAASVSARRLRFRHRPSIETSFPGRGERTTSSSSSRENLPEEVETGRTYRDVRVDWRIASAVAEEQEAASELRPPRERAEDCRP